MRKCFPLRLPDGGTTIVCGSFPKEKHCVVCGTFATRLCDYRKPDGSTCDAPMCDEHTLRVGANKDFCPLHRSAASSTLPLFPSATGEPEANR